MKKTRGLTPSNKFDFGGGWVTMIAKTRLAPNQLIKAKNININVDGEAEVRGGCIKVTPETAFGTEIDRFIHFKTDTFNKIVAMGGIYVKEWNDSTNLWVLIDNTMPDTEEFRSMVIAQDMLFIGASGTGEPMKYVHWDGSGWMRKAGIVAPTTKVSRAEGAAGNLNGTYTWYYTYYNSDAEQESDPSPISDPLTVTNKKVTLSGFVASADPQVDKINIYRNPHGFTAWYYVGQKDNDTNNFEDDVADENLGLEISFRNGVPPKANILLWHLNRMYYVDADLPNRIRISEPFKPGSVYAESYVDIEAGDGGKILALAPCYDNIVVLKSTGVFTLIIDKLYPENSDYTILADDFGCVAPMSVENIGEEVMFLSPEGLKLTINAGSALKDVTILVPTEDGKYIDPIANVFRDCFQSVLHKAVGIYYENKDQYCISVPYYSDANNDLTLVWHRSLGVFTYHQDWNVKATAMWREYGNKLLYRSHNDQYIYQHDTGFQDNGADISFEVQSGWNDLNGIPDRKKIRKAFPTVYGADGIEVSYEVMKDFESGGDQRTIIHKGASYWGYAHWGQNYWGASGEVLYENNFRVKGRVFSTRFFGTVSNKIGIAEYQYFFQPKSL